MRGSRDRQPYPLIQEQLVCNIPHLHSFLTATTSYQSLYQLLMPQGLHADAETKNERTKERATTLLYCQLFSLLVNMHWVEKESPPRYLTRLLINGGERCTLKLAPNNPFVSTRSCLLAVGVLYYAFVSPHPYGDTDLPAADFPLFFPRIDLLWFSDWNSFLEGILGERQPIG